MLNKEAVVNWDGNAPILATWAGRSSVSAFLNVLLFITVINNVYPPFRCFYFILIQSLLLYITMLPCKAGLPANSHPTAC